MYVHVYEFATIVSFLCGCGIVFESFGSGFRKSPTMYYYLLNSVGSSVGPLWSGKCRAVGKLAYHSAISVFEWIIGSPNSASKSRPKSCDSPSDFFPTNSMEIIENFRKPRCGMHAFSSSISGCKDMLPTYEVNAWTRIQVRPFDRIYTCQNIRLSLSGSQCKGLYKRWPIQSIWHCLDGGFLLHIYPWLQVYCGYWCESLIWEASSVYMTILFNRVDEIIFQGWGRSRSRKVMAARWIMSWCPDWRPDQVFLTSCKVCVSVKSLLDWVHSYVYFIVCLSEARESRSVPSQVCCHCCGFVAGDVIVESLSLYSPSKAWDALNYYRCSPSLKYVVRTDWVSVWVVLTDTRACSWSSRNIFAISLG